MSRVSLKEVCLKRNERVITPQGLGKIVSFKPKWLVELDEAVAGRKKLIVEEGQVSVESDFSVVRIINTREVLLSNAQNYPSWKLCLETLAQPFSQDETLIALNFKEKRLELNRFLHAPPYQIIEAYMDMYWEMEQKVYESLGEAMRAWKKIEMLSGTSDHILLYVLVSLDESRILARALFTTVKVIKREVY